jgi:hypothetical protein
MELIRKKAVVPAAATSLAACLAVLCTLLAPSAATAARCDKGTVPPGNSEVDQYAESIPGGCGNVPFDGGNGNGNGASNGGSGGSGGSSGSSGGGSGSGSSLPPGTGQALKAQGPDGLATAAIARSTAPGGIGSSGPGGSNGDGSGDATFGITDVPSAGGSDSPFEAVLAALGEAISGGSGSGDGDGIGIVMPLLLGAILIGGIVFGLRRRIRG